MYPQEYFRRRIPASISPFNPEDEEARRLLAQSVYTRPRRANPLAPAFELEASPTVRPVTYTRPRMVEEPADELTKIAETRDYHANQHITNDDPWWKNMLKGFGRGALYGMASGQGLAGVVGGAATGGLMNLAMPAMDDQIENQEQVARLDDNYSRREAQELRGYARESARLGVETGREQLSQLRQAPEYKRRDRADAERKAELELLSKAINDLDEFDPDAPDQYTRAIVERAAKVGFPVYKKQKGETWSLVVTPDGRVIKGSNRGNVEEAKDPKTGQPFSVSRPVSINAKDILPAVHSVLGIRGDDEIKDLARAAVPKLKTKTRTADINPALLREGSPYRNPDGTPNEAAIWKAVNEETLSLRDAFPAVTDTDVSDFERETAAQRQRLRGAQGERQRAAERYAAIVEEISRKPNPQATRELTLNDLNRALKAVMDNPNPKERARDLEGFFRDLYSVKIR